MEFTFLKVQLVPAFVAILLGGHGLRKRSLSPSGALAALVVGYLMLSVSLRSFGVNLIVFYLVGSRATKCRLMATVLDILCL
jgi:uncharacterized membrane protein